MTPDQTGLLNLLKRRLALEECLKMKGGNGKDVLEGR